MKKMERILKAVANRRRLAILKYLKNNKEASVGSIADEIKLSLKSTSKHLTVLSAADILEKEQRSTAVFYRLAANQDSAVKQIISMV